MIPLAAADLEVVSPDKSLEAQRMEILRRDLPAHLDVRALGGGLVRGRHDSHP